MTGLRSGTIFYFAALIAASAAIADADTPVLLQVPDNMGFEALAFQDSMPVNWTCDGAVCAYDTACSRSGGYSARLTAAESGAEGYLERTIPMYYLGEELTFSGWIRGGDSPPSAVGAFIAVTDRMGNTLGYSEYEFPGVPGSSWDRFSITVPKSAFADSVDFGVWVRGPGEVHADDFQLLLNGRPLVESSVRGPFGAILDTEFDSGSGIEFGELDRFQMESLVILGRMWNFLKYHHPKVCSGELNWDHELFRVLPGVIAASDQASREAALMCLLPSVEPIPAADLVEGPGDGLMTQSDHSWIDGAEIGYSLAYLLEAVLQGRHQGESYYLRDGFMPVFFEESYPDISPEDDGYRLLGLYRFWGIVEYWFPYKYATDTTWGAQLEASLPDFVNAGGEVEYRLAAMRLASSVGDGHCAIYGTSEALDGYLGSLYLPVELAFVEDSWVITGFLHENALGSPLRIGDAILSVDGEALSDRAEDLLPLARGSNMAAKLRNIGYELLRGAPETAESVMERGGQEFQLDLNRVSIDEMDWSLASGPAYGSDAFSIMESGFGFVDLSSLSMEDVDSIRETFNSVPGMVIDMRGYPAEMVLYQMAEFLVPEPEPFCLVSRADLDEPGTFFMAETLFAGGGGEGSFQGPVALLIDEGSVSSAEFHTMAWRLAPEARVFGHPTAGADGNVNTFTLPGGLRTGFSGIGIYWPDGSETQRTGILPDTVVTPTVQGIRDGRDEVLEAAVNWLEEASGE